VTGAVTPRLALRRAARDTAVAAVLYALAALGSLLAICAVVRL
jgi:hypothetical protein